MSTTPPTKESDNPPRPAARAPATRPKSPRLRRVKDYEREALGNPDALAANLGVINAGLMRVAHRLLKAADRALASSPCPLEDLPALLPAINVCAQVTRQIHRLAEFDGQRRAGGAGDSPPPPRLPGRAQEGPETARADGEKPGLPGPR